MVRFNSLSSLFIVALLASACQASPTADTRPSNHVDCEGTIAWSAEVHTGNFIDHTTFWIVFESEYIEDYFKDLHVDVTLDDQPVSNGIKLRGTPEPYSGICTANNQRIEGMRSEYTLLLPSLSDGEHTILWSYTITGDMANGFLDDPQGITGEYVITFQGD